MRLSRIVRMTPGSVPGIVSAVSEGFPRNLSMPQGAIRHQRATPRAANGNGMNTQKGVFPMSTEDNKALIHRYFDAISGKDKPPEVVNSYATDEELKHHIALYEASFPHYQLIAEDMIAEGDKVVVRATFSGTHKGDLMGITPTGKQVTIPIMLISQALFKAKLDMSNLEKITVLERVLLLWLEDDPVDFRLIEPSEVLDGIAPVLSAQQRL